MRSLIATLLLGLSLTAHAGRYELVIDEGRVNFSDGSREALTINGQSPAPELRFKEGETVEIAVTNKLDRMTALHWHGIILPYTQDGVPGVSFPGIKPGETFTYRFTLNQSGTYWYHAHADFQEQEGLYGSLIIEPRNREPYRYDREYTVLLFDWQDEKPERTLANLKKQADYYNDQKQTFGDFFAEVGRNGLAATVKDRWDWGSMRMMKNGYRRRQRLPFSGQRPRHRAELDSIVQAGGAGALAHHQWLRHELFRSAYPGAADDGGAGRWQRCAAGGGRPVAYRRG